MRRFTVLLVAGAIGAACSSFGSNDDGTVPADAGPDRTTTPDASEDGLNPPPAPGGDAGVDATVVYEDFETGCGGWQDKGAAATATTVAHSGTGGCRFCRTTGGFAAKHYEGVFTAGTYQATAFAKNETADGGSLQLTLQTQTLTGTVLDNKPSYFTVGSSFKSVATPNASGSPAFDRFEVDVAFLNGATGCIDLDDLRIVAQP